jgi:hypothetical protein
MEMANTLAYHGTATITAVKSFIEQTPEAVFTTLFIFNNLQMAH